MASLIGALRGLALSLILATLIPPPALAGSAKDDWIKSLVVRLKLNRRSPAQATDEGGTAKVVFRIDRTGHLLSAALSESTGDPALDQEALALIERAQPFAPPPPELSDGDLTFMVPIVFAPRRTSGVQFDEMTLNDTVLKARLNGICRGC
ncbi:energy transducer TonB [Bradyrhizobium sp. SRS-191]|uniref:energy transducer TonB family protein n=1 Tax=Bradyrhizobium sp. SRS-191 TaxID=2962606 RepID=UPI00211EC1D8|nr:energy transducer TonB [Bradyrhizobium sp. SRS-191]